MRNLIILLAWVCLVIVVYGAINGVLFRGSNFVNPTKAAGRIPDLNQTEKQNK